MDEPVFGSKVRDIREGDDSPTWIVVEDRGNYVLVTGPGPCRSIKMIDCDEFDEVWQVVE